ncbi:eukaryotic initiation factor 4A [Reticulomyxa filosa]|uniref:RNA helicase n=1 Tax=Reticulomyxa filosa TaxID=46433 RepID=X6NDG1_RETFI|nr:eukaryotic initiation factor 4A [Reticulomyxa filosa]|eukprot:ETO24031.1 eukaryotic initiation factor 4A [Reticulomyxa filosa]
MMCFRPIGRKPFKFGLFRNIFKIFFLETLHCGQKHKNVEFKSFDQMGLSKSVKRGIYGFGLVTPTPVQKRCISEVLRNSDMIVQAKPQSGKSVAYCIAALAKISISLRDKLQILIIAPQRENALHIYQVQFIYFLKKCIYILTKIGCYAKPSIRCCLGGKSVRQDIQGLQKGAQIVVGTIGRILDMIDRRVLKMDYLTTVIFDEMLHYQFKSSVLVAKMKPKNLFQYVQIWIFQGLIADYWYSYLKKIVYKPVKILAKRQYLISKEIRHYFVEMKDSEDLLQRVNVLVDLLSNEHARSITQALMEEYIPATSFHGDICQGERELILNHFISGSSRFLVGSNLLSQCLHSCAMDVVINLDFPDSKNSVANYNTYMQRVGRICARLQEYHSINTNKNDSLKYMPPVVINFIACEQHRIIQNEIETFFQFKMQKLPLNW